MNRKIDIKKIIKNPFKLIRPLGSRGYLKWISDELYLKLAFFGETGRKLDLNSPKTYNEKIQWLKLNDRKQQYVNFVDKYSVRHYIKKEIGSEYLIPMIAIYEDVDEIDWESLPKQFVLKCTHGSSSNIVCNDKQSLDIESSKNKLNKWMKTNWYWYGREWPYKDVKPRIICEKFIKTPDGKVPKDYKVMCFNGEPKLIQVHTDRFNTTYTKDYYDINWKKTCIRQGAPNSEETEKKPKNFNLMLEISRKLSKNIPFARIDFYEQNNNLLFGEITLYPTSGFKLFEDYSDDIKLGSYINLPTK